MKELQAKFKANVLLYKIAYARAALYTAVLWGSCWMTAMNKLSWSLLSGDDKFNIIVGIVVTWGTGMIAFIDKSAQQISSGQIPGIEVTETTRTVTEADGANRRDTRKPLNTLGGAGTSIEPVNPTTQAPGQTTATPPETKP